MQQFSSSTSRPLALSSSTEAQVYGLFAVAMALTVLGSYIGMAFATVLLSNGTHVLLSIVSLGIILTSGLWMDKSPLNVVLFGAFPVIMGITITPYLLAVVSSYVNGFSILINALAATVFMGLAAAVFARATSWNLGLFGRVFFFAILGLIGMSILQLFVPALRTPAIELAVSGAGVLVFAFFTAYDLQRIQSLGRIGANPFLLALSLYLDIFNLFLYILRFMTALSGERR